MSTLPVLFSIKTVLSKGGCIYAKPDDTSPILDIYLTSHRKTPGRQQHRISGVNVTEVRSTTLVTASTSKPFLDAT